MSPALHRTSTHVRGSPDYGMQLVEARVLTTLGLFLLTSVGPSHIGRSNKYRCTDRRRKDSAASRRCDAGRRRAHRGKGADVTVPCRVTGGPPNPLVAEYPTGEEHHAHGGTLRPIQFVDRQRRLVLEAGEIPRVPASGVAARTALGGHHVRHDPVPGLLDQPPRQDRRTMGLHAVHLCLRGLVQPVPRRRTCRHRSRQNLRLHHRTRLLARRDHLRRDSQPDGVPQPGPSGEGHAVANLVLAVLYALTIAGGAIGEWNYYILGSLVEAALLAGVVYYAWTWPKATDTVTAPADRPGPRPSALLTAAGARVARHPVLSLKRRRGSYRRRRQSWKQEPRTPKAIRRRIDAPSRGWSRRAGRGTSGRSEQTHPEGIRRRGWAPCLADFVFTDDHATTSGDRCDARTIKTVAGRRIHVTDGGHRRPTEGSPPRRGLSLQRGRNAWVARRYCLTGSVLTATRMPVPARVPNDVRRVPIVARTATAMTCSRRQPIWSSSPSTVTRPRRSGQGLGQGDEGCAQARHLGEHTLRAACHPSGRDVVLGLVPRADQATVGVDASFGEVCP